MDGLHTPMASRHYWWYLKDLYCVFVCFAYYTVHIRAMEFGLGSLYNPWHWLWTILLDWSLWKYLYVHGKWVCGRPVIGGHLNQGHVRVTMLTHICHGVWSFLSESECEKEREGEQQNSHIDHYIKQQLIKTVWICEILNSVTDVTVSRL